MLAANFSPVQRLFLAVVATAFVARTGAAQNLILNGDFENTTAVGCAFNTPNSQLTIDMPGVTGFGAADEIDVMNDPGGCGYLLPPQSGNVKLGVTSSVVGGPADAFSFALSSPVASGATYQLSFWAVAFAQSFAPDTAPLEFGVSNNPSSFGTLVVSATPQAGNWQHFVLSFVAPSTSPYLTVQQNITGDVWNHIDNFSLTLTSPATPSSYCTCGTSTNGCCAAMTANADPSVTFAHSCIITANNVEGQHNGLIFYGVNGTVAVPWNTNSFLCVKAPTQRTGTKNSQGTLNQCNGSLTLDWNAFQLANPGALGQPFVAGQDVRAQAWFRDPVAGKTSNLSDGLALTLRP